MISEPHCGNTLN